MKSAFVALLAIVGLGTTLVACETADTTDTVDPAPTETVAPAESPAVSPTTTP